MIKIDNSYTNMQKNQYFVGASNHEEHNSNSDLGHPQWIYVKCYKK